MAVPFMNHIEVLPLVSRHNRSAVPLPSKSRCPTNDQVLGTLPSAPDEATPAPFMSHTAMSPLVSRQTMSLIILASRSCVLVGGLVSGTGPLHCPNVSPSLTGGLGAVISECLQIVALMSLSLAPALPTVGNGGI
jgi:hypothetical protein